jgi:hypothetical protein
MFSSPVMILVSHAWQDGQESALSGTFPYPGMKLAFLPQNRIIKED